MTTDRTAAQPTGGEAGTAPAPVLELREAEPGKGFDLLPAPQPGDLFYDIEGDPHYEGGLEYLHGFFDTAER